MAALRSKHKHFKIQVNFDRLSLVNNCRCLFYNSKLFTVCPTLYVLQLSSMFYSYNLQIKDLFYEALLKLSKRKNNKLSMRHSSENNFTWSRLYWIKETNS